MANVITLHPKPAAFNSKNLDTTGKFVLVDSDEVLDRDWPEKVKDPVLYASASAALDAGETLFAVGQNYRGQNISSCTRFSDERIEIILGE